MESSVVARNDATDRLFPVQADKLMMKGGQLYALRNIVGHNDLKITQRYAKLSTEHVDAERDRIDTIRIPAPIPSSEEPSQTQTK